MKVADYVKGVKTFKKTELLTKISMLSVVATDIQANLERMEVNKISLEREIQQWAITKSITRGLETAGLRGVGFNKAVEAALISVIDIVSILEKEVNKSRDLIWDGALLNLRQANVLILAEQIDQWLTYTSLVYDVLITTHNKNSGNPDSLLSKVDLRLINQTVEYYKGTFLFLIRGSKRFQKDLEAIPEIEVSEASLSVMEGTGTPIVVNQQLGVHSFNPYFWYLNNRMKLDVKEIERARQENERFAMKISQAVNLKNGTNDAELDERIEDYQDRIMKNVHEIEEIKGKYA